ncbi:pectinesterase family protein [Algibacillus agarilyticus]|uniref:pectinesterase family protein n=1 Tax=Algibacillus agarilyticus TaxID=2234133 RepID=UPI001300AE3B|nr:pectinesterase family protein [Algibacillus agarilyticus]
MQKKHDELINKVVPNTRLLTGWLSVISRLLSQLYAVKRLALLIFLSQSAYALESIPQIEFDAIVSAKPQLIPSNKPHYLTIQAALDAAPIQFPDQNKKRHVIFISAGDYYEKLTISKPNIALVGNGKTTTRIHYDAYSGLQKPGSDKRWGTFGSATLNVNHLNFYAENLTIENSYDFPANDKLAKTDPKKERHSQAVALMVGAGGHHAVFNHVAVKGYQDTVFIDGGINYFYNSDIYGHVDYIFGRGNALFEASTIINRRRHAPNNLKYTGYVTAPSTDKKQLFGFTFMNCRFVHEPGVPANSVPLGRPWHPTTTFKDGRYADPNAIGKTVVLNSFLDKHIAQVGWSSMKGTSRIAGQKDVFEPESARFFEYANSGPGAVVNPKRRQLSTEDAAYYSKQNVLSGWQPSLSAAVVGGISPLVAGQDGRVIKVTNLNKSGEGSFQAALAAKGPRNIVFTVAGVIDLDRSMLSITEPYVTVHGNTAPTPGITLIKGGIRIITHDVKLTHLHIRPGDANLAKRFGWAPDAVSISREGAYNIWIDHCSLTWAVDENIGISSSRLNGYAGASHDIWVSNSIIAEALDYATHRKGKHSKGVLVHDFVQNVHFYRNLFAHNDRRNAYFKTAATGTFINNVIYNPGSGALHMGYIPDEFAGYRAELRRPTVSVIGNILLYGRDTYSDLALASHMGQAYQADNLVLNLSAEPMPVVDSAILPLYVEPIYSPFTDKLASAVLLPDLLNSVGAFPAQRDRIDKRIVSSVTAGTGRIIDSQELVGGYPSVF